MASDETERPSQKPRASQPAPGEPSGPAKAVLEGQQNLAEHVECMALEGRAASSAARIVEEVLQVKPQLGAPHIARLVRLLLEGPARSTQASATCLPLLTKTAPAKVARHLETLRGGFDQASETGRDGMVRIFVALCLASVAYQRRVIDVLEKALGAAEPKQLVTWSEIVLPALKGEPHAQARAVVEQRVPSLPKPQAQQLATLLGIKIRR
jgi:hypothetical protein